MTGGFVLVVAVSMASAYTPTHAPQKPDGASAGPCKVVFDAMLKETTTPHHLVTTRPGAAPSEGIATGDAMYVKVGGVWRKSPMTMHGMLAQQEENIRSATLTSCTALPDEVVNGTPAAVWHARYEQPDLGASESKVWISKATGLPLRTEVSVQAGQKTSVTTTYDYDHIVAPK
jgi:hypothetical protein